MKAVYCTMNDTTFLEGLLVRKAKFNYVDICLYGVGI